MSKLIQWCNLFFVCLIMASCGTTNTQQLRINIGAEPHSLDPRRARDLQSQTMAKMFFDGLMRLNPEEKAELALAETIEVSDDGKTYIFHLREARWSNGDPVSADDFAYAWKKVLDPSFPTDTASQFYLIQNAKKAKEGKVSLDDVGIKVLGPRTLEVELENPAPYFLELLAMPIFYPVNQRIDQISPHWAESSSSYVCNGPFMPTEWRHSDKIEAVKNPRYWDAASVKLQQMEVVMVAEQTELLMFQKKELDWAGSPLSVLPIDALPVLKKEKGFYTKPFLATYFFRTNLYQPPFNHPAMRKAFALAINRQQIVEHVLQGNQLPATGLVPPSMGIQEAPYFADGDVEAAKALFAQALSELSMRPEGLKNLSLLYVASDRNHTIAQAAQQQWRDAFGITVQLEPVERKVYFDRTSKMQYQLVIGSWTADYNDPINFLEVFKYKANGTNNTGWEDPIYTSLLDRSHETVDLKDRLALLQESEKILMDAMPIIPVFHYTMLYMKNDKVRDVVVSNLGGVDFKWAYLLEEK